MEPNYWYIIFIILGLNSLLCIKTIRRADFSFRQKLMHLLIIWLVPVFGFLLFFNLYKSFDAPVRKSKRKFGDGPNDSGYVSSNSGGGNDNS